MMKVAIYGNKCNGAEEFIIQLFRELEKVDAAIVLFSPFYDIIKKTCDFSPSISSVFNGYEDIPRDCDFMITVGGDGTFLKSIAVVRELGIPIVGVNTGRLGFLASISRNEISSALALIKEKKYSVEKRPLIQITANHPIFGDFPYALNDITFQKSDSAMITIHVSINGEYLNSYWADGLIVSTPTGSTAYSLSVGGPILLPQNKNLIILAMAPHTLTVRPIVIPDDVELTIKVDSRSNHYLVTKDSSSAVAGTDFEFHIKTSPLAVNVIKPHGIEFYSTLRNKLMWGMDKRN